MKIIDNQTKSLITEIKLTYLPRVNEHINFQSSIYIVNQIEHTENGVNVFVTKTNNESFFF